MKAEAPQGNRGASHPHPLNMHTEKLTPHTGGASGENPPASAGDMRPGVSPWVGKSPWRSARQPAPVFLPGESHGRRSLVGSSP